MLSDSRMKQRFVMARNWTGNLVFLLGFFEGKVKFLGSIMVIRLCPEPALL